MSDYAVEVFVTTNPVELEAAKGVLEEAGIPTTVRDLTSRPYPLHVGGLMAELRLVVADVNSEAARELLKEGIEDGYLETGEVL